MHSKLQSCTAFFLLAAFFLAAMGYALFSDGMFMDGTIYAAVSKNMAQGLGTFWQPHLSETLFPEFYQHPPLAFGLQALAFKIFGDSFLVERFYSLSTYILTAFFIVQIWIEIGKPKQKAWIPLLFWIANPLVIWAVANNMLENTLQVFILASVLMLIKSIKSKNIFWIFLGGVFLFLGLLTKGLVALFPLTFYFWIWLFERKMAWTKMMLNTGLLIGVTILPLAVLLLTSEAALHALQAYFNRQIVKSLMEVQTVPSRFFIVGRLFNELLISIGIILLVFILFRKKLQQFRLSFKESAARVYLFLALGFSGVLPIMVSLKQSGFYMLPAFPFFAIAFGILMLPFLENAKAGQPGKYFVNRYSGILSLLILIIVFVVTFSFKNKIGRESEMLRDVYSIRSVVPNNEILDIPKTLSQDWSLQAYFARYANISLDDVSKNPHHFYLTKINSMPPQADRYKKMDLNLNRFSLYQLKNP